LAEALDKLQWRAVRVHFEQLVAEPESTIRDLCGQWGIEFDTNMIDYGRQGLPHWKFGDQENVYNQSRPDAKNENAWKASLDNPQIWRFAIDYLEHLSPETMGSLGYDRAELRALLEDRRPGDTELAKTSGLAECFDGDPAGPSYQHMLDRLRVADERHFQLYERAAKAEDRVYRLEQALATLRSSRTYRRLRWGLPRLRLFDEAIDTALGCN
jgi:hypothetical protein